MIRTRIGNSTDIEGILLLQEKNLERNLTKQEQENGFVTTPFTVKQLEGLIQENGVFVATDNQKIIAYLFAGTWKYFEQWEIFNFMVARFPMLSFNKEQITTQNSFQYGPVCLDKDYRGKGLFNLVFEEMRLVFSKRYPISITFINKINIISEKAHTKKLGWKIIDEFNFNQNTYIGLAFDMRKSVTK